jgi:uncharacterized protein
MDPRLRGDDKLRITLQAGKAMILTQDSNDSLFQVRAYRPGLITVNDITYQRSLIIAPDRLILDWPPQSFSELKPEDWQSILDLNPELIILGTGEQFKIPHPSLLAPIYSHKKIGVESMDTGAACRTFMALASEGRRVVSALIIK